MGWSDDFEKSKFEMAMEELGEKSKKANILKLIDLYIDIDVYGINRRKLETHLILDGAMKTLSDLGHVGESKVLKILEPLIKGDWTEKEIETIEIEAMNLMNKIVMTRREANGK